MNGSTPATTRSPAELMALQSATRRYGDAASLTALHTGAHLDVFG
jgi:hypothetical protein